LRRIAAIAALLVAVGALVAASAGADDTHTYKLEMYNAFGLVKGSEVKVADVNAGTITDLSINSDKRAVATVELSGPLSTLGTKTVCSSEPQSLIAEYFITCTPKGPPLPDGGQIDANHVKMTVQNDLVFNTLRMPYNQRLQLLINEFGTALAGNPQALNDAIRQGAPALTNLHKALKLLADQNTVIRNLTSDSDHIIARLTQRRSDVIRFIKEAGDTAEASSERRADLSTDFDRLDDFLAQLQPTSVQLASAARQTTPLLSDLRQAAPGLTTLSQRLPAFNRSAQTSIVSLGKASQVGETALRHANRNGVIRDLADSGRDAFATADPLAKLFQDLDTPKRAVEEDTRAAKSCSDKTKPCYSTGRKGPTGYTGLEGLLNYAYYQAGSTNQFDDVGHILHFTLDTVYADQCGNFNADSSKVPLKGGGTINGSDITDINQLANCVGWLGLNQPGITTPDHAGPYDPSVCPNGSADLAVCDPNGAKQASKAGGGKSNKRGAGKNASAGGPNAGGAPDVSQPQGGTSGLPNAPSAGDLPVDPQNPTGPLDGILNPNGNGLGGAINGAVGGHKGPKGTKSPSGGSSNAAEDLLDFLFSP
jgi:ABC-type transporter Mla subunit MlaD